MCRLLRLRQVPILQQLRLEEALLRADDSNWCILNDGSPTPAIVMGISGSARRCLPHAQHACNLSMRSDHMHAAPPTGSWRSWCMWTRPGRRACRS